VSRQKCLLLVVRHARIGTRGRVISAQIVSKSHVQVLVALQDLESARPRRTFQQLTQLRMNWASYHHFSAEEWLRLILQQLRTIH
jgi:hypothetical protein